MCGYECVNNFYITCIKYMVQDPTHDHSVTFSFRLYFEPEEFERQVSRLSKSTLLVIFYVWVVSLVVTFLLYIPHIISVHQNSFDLLGRSKSPSPKDSVLTPPKSFYLSSIDPFLSLLHVHRPRLYVPSICVHSRWEFVTPRSPIYVDPRIRSPYINTQD